MYKKVFSFAVAMFILLNVGFTSNTTHVSAENDKNEETVFIVQMDGKKYLYDSVNKYYIASSQRADGTSVSLEQRKIEIENSRNISEHKINKIDIFMESGRSNDIYDVDESEFSPSAIVDVSYYTEEFSYNFTDSAQRVTTNFNCPAGSAAPCPMTITTALTVTDQWSAGVTAGDKNYVKAAVSYTWVTSTATSTTFSSYLPAGRSGYIIFYPRYTVTEGNLHYRYIVDGIYQNLGDKFVRAYNPKKLGGFADGTFDAIIL